MRDVLEPQKPKELTHSEKAAALDYLMLLKEERTREIKVRGVPMGESNRNSCPKKKSVHQLFQLRL